MEELKKRLVQIKETIDFEEKKKILRDLEAQSSHPDFWKDNLKAQEVMREIADLKREIEEVEEAELAITVDDLQAARELLGKLELRTYLSEPYDKNDAILSLHSGQGGTEAQDWAAMLARMYQRFAERRGWKTVVLEQSPGEEAGFKTVTFEIKGPLAFGYLKREAGVHRLVRQSPFNAQNLRQTSFALVEVIPVLESVFAESNVPLPWTTRTIIWISNTMITYWWLIILVLILVIGGAIAFFKLTARGRYYWDVIALKAPIVRYISYDLYMSRFARTIAMLIASGIPIIETIKITASSVNNRVYTRILRGVVAQVEKGIPMSVPLEKSKEIPILVSQMVMVGEQTGRMETMMEKLADFYEEQVDTKLKTLSSLIEPVVIVIIGLGVGFLIYSILYPIYGLVQVI